MTSIPQLITPLQPVYIDTSISGEPDAALLLEDDACLTLDSCDRGSCIAIDSKQIGTHAGHLASLLKQQLERHLLTKIKTASKQTYPLACASPSPSTL